MRATRVTAVAVGALVGFLPEELVDQVSVRSVQLDAVEADFLRGSSRLRVSLDGGIDIVLSHGVLARGAHGMCAVRGRRSAGNLQAEVPELRKNVSAGGVHLIDDVAPAVQRGFAIEVRDLGIESRGGMRRIGSFGDDQSHAAFGATAVVGRDVLAGDAAG